MRMLYRMSNERERVICVTLSETEWQAFIARQPQPVNWLLCPTKIISLLRGLSFQQLGKTG